MGIIDRMRKQQAVYWAPAPNGGDFGEDTYLAPIQLRVRWVDKQEEFIDKAGERQVSSSKVYVGQDVELGGYLWLGDLDDLTNDQKANPGLLDDADTIKAVNKTPDLKARQFLRVAIL